jgi:hypothetical protein
MKHLLAFVLVLLATPVFAGDLGPVVPKSTGTPHPEGNLYMRINHMNLMQHDRDQTMRLGERDISNSLKGCVDCHAVNGDDGQPVSAKNEKHFCRVCHDFAAVKVDCFQCHNSKPQITTEAMLKPDVADENDIAVYLKEAEE